MMLALALLPSADAAAPAAPGAKLPGEPGGAELYARLTALVGSVNQTVLQALEQRASAPAKKEALGLHTFGVGLMTTWTVGLGPIVQATAQPEIRLFYTRAEEPIFP